MGYYIDIEIENLVIPASQVTPCLNAINDLFKSNLKSPIGYSWVDNPKTEKGYENLKVALDSWRYYAEENDNGDVEIEFFTGEKLGDDELLFTTIAPFVSSGAVVTFYGENQERWRYVFENGEIKEEQATVIWE